MEKVNRWIASYRTATRTWSTKDCAKKLPHTWLWTEAGRNETRHTHRAPLTQALLDILQSFAKAFANALAVRPCRNRTEICLLAATKRAGGDEGPMAVWISWSDKFPIYRERNNRWLLELSTVILSISPNFAQRNPRIGYL